MSHERVDSLKLRRCSIIGTGSLKYPAKKCLNLSFSIGFKGSTDHVYYEIVSLLMTCD